MKKVKFLSNQSILILLMSIFLFSFTNTFSQNIIKGTIVDAKTKEPLIGASIMIDGSSQGTAADLDGKFSISTNLSGKLKITASYVAYKTEKIEVNVLKNKETIIEIKLNPDERTLDEVEVVAKANRESENILLLEQRKALVATQAVGAKELSRKGISNAEAAVSQVSGVSKQDGVKNVFVRGLGDRYNVTLLNGFPIPSEDPEYKNISLDFFGTDVIQNIGVNKVFTADSYGDVGGAIIDIMSKELTRDRTFGVDLSAGFNSGVLKNDFLKQDGSNYFGFANTQRPSENVFNFPNSLDPSKIGAPINHSYGVYGGKAFRLANNPLSVFLVASHSTDFSFTEEKIKNTTTDGTIFQDQVGEKYSQNINQLILGNLSYGLNKKHNIYYNFMMVHANNQYVGEFQGLNAETHQDSETGEGFLRRQQTNDNLLLTNQLFSTWKLSKKMRFNLGASYNAVKGLEPDRRENYLSKQTDGTYILTGSNRQRRFFSTLKENDFNVKTNIEYKLPDKFSNENSSILFGYNGRFVKDNFNALEYYFDALSGNFPIENLKLDDLYNQQNIDNGRFSMNTGETNSYKVNKYINSAFTEVSYQLARKLLANIGFRYDNVDMTVDHHVQHTAPGKVLLKKNYFLPSLNLKYDLNDKNTIRFGLSKTYTLPQSKEISPYQYVNISFASQGNPNIKSSDNYNADLKWDYYLSTSELISLTGFYKHILNPISRVDEGNSAGLLTYTNISDHATVGGVELEVRKNIFNQVDSKSERVNKLSVGFNASYIYTGLKLQMLNTPERDSHLEGASPLIANFDISYNYSKGVRNLNTSLVFKYFSSRIHTIGSRSYNDIIEEGVPTMDFISSYKFNKHFSAKLKFTNILNPSYKLTRKVNDTNENIVLNEFKKGQNISLGISYEL